MMRALRWGFLLVALAAIAYLAVAVDFGGRTLVDRLLGEDGPRPEPQVKPAAAGPKAAKSADPGKAVDELTDEDRADLTKLIEQRLDGPAADPSAAVDGGAAAKSP